MSEEKIEVAQKNGIVSISIANISKVAKWLLDNEYEIADEMMDYGELSGLFCSVIGRCPVKGKFE